ncbi:hypothetical protein [Prochlorococcus marinus]|uniref:hypothetical protein n=1 Tax=Prochlorococcus marinus TaxID=1219 RepID=UPI001ADA8709|nr:hypothetical protein [Prochlorococcus marinus]MBO8221293.1 hypothetical protein [Prochlorococcus marinus CUG1417]MBW3074109.1 hypothetical protein [Prochlorococcus marinus str. MU1417]
MKFAFYFFIIAQILNFLNVFAEKVIKDSSEFNSIKWEKIKKNKDEPPKKIIWKSYKGEENFFKNKKEEGFKLVGDNSAKIEPLNWRFRNAHQWYFDAQRNEGSSSNMQLFGGKIDWMRGDWWYLTGQGLIAYGGDAGGYSEGHLGVGFLGPKWKNWQLFSEMLIGTGGGGGVDVGNSLLYKPSVGLEYNINKDFSLQTGIGKVISKEGNLDAKTLEVILVWHF